jgi:preprotein translocase subunit SecE
VTFFQESRAELRKVSWPTRQETLNLTAAVVVMTVFMAVFLGLVDYILNFLVKPILGT